MPEQIFDQIQEDISNFSELEEASRIINENYNKILNYFVGVNHTMFTSKKVTESLTLTRNKRPQYVEVYSSSTALTLTLPLADADGTYVKKDDSFIIKDSSENSETYAVTLALNGGKLVGNPVSSTNPVISKNKGFIWLRYVGWDSVNSWGLWEILFADLTATLYTKYNPVGAFNNFNTAALVAGGNIFAPAFTTGGGFYGISYRGTVAAPTATQSGDLLAHVRGLGFNGSAFATAATMQLTATEAWISGTNQGAETSFRITGNGTATLATALTLKQTKAAEFRGNLEVNVNNTYNAFSASLAPTNTYGVNAFTVTSDPRIKEEIEQFLFNEELLDKLIESECFISWKWKNFENPEIIKNELQKIKNPKTGEEEEIEVPVITQSYYKSDHKRRHTGTNAFKVLKVLIQMGISTEQFPIVSIENYKPEMIDLIRNMTEKEFLNTSEDKIGRLTIKNELLIPLLANVSYRQGQKLKAMELRLQAIEGLLLEKFGG